jgi:hypothetical protein
MGKIISFWALQKVETKPPLHGTHHNRHRRTP